MLPYYKQTLSNYFAPKISALVDNTSDAKLPEEREVLLLLVQLCHALDHLQRHRVVHRDVKVKGFDCGGVCCLSPTPHIEYTWSE